MLFWLILGHFWGSVVTLVTFSSSLDNFERNPKNLKKIFKTNSKNLIKLKKKNNNNKKKKISNNIYF